MKRRSKQAFKTQILLKTTQIFSLEDSMKYLIQQTLSNGKFSTVKHLISNYHLSKAILCS